MVFLRVVNKNIYFDDIVVLVGYLYLLNNICYFRFVFIVCGSYIVCIGHLYLLATDKMSNSPLSNL